MNLRQVTATTTTKESNRVRVQGKASRFPGIVLVIFVLILLLIPAAQAAGAGTIHVKIEGTGQGEVSSVGGLGAFRSEDPVLNEELEAFGSYTKARRRSNAPAPLEYAFLKLSAARASSSCIETASLGLCPLSRRVRRDSGAT
jgi:hypothetical protein